MCSYYYLYLRIRNCMCSCLCCGCLVLTGCWVGNGDEGGAPREAVWRRCLRRLRARRSYRFVMPILSLRHAHHVPHQLYRILQHISAALGVMLLLLFVVYFYCMDFSVVVVRIWMFSPAGLCRCFVLVQGGGKRGCAVGCFACGAPAARG